LPDWTDPTSQVVIAIWGGHLLGEWPGYTVARHVADAARWKPTASGDSTRTAARRYPSNWETGVWTHGERVASRVRRCGPTVGGVHRAVRMDQFGEANQRAAPTGGRGRRLRFHLTSGAADNRAHRANLHARRAGGRPFGRLDAEIHTSPSRDMVSSSLPSPRRECADDKSKRSTTAAKSSSAESGHGTSPTSRATYAGQRHAFLLRRPYCVGLLIVREWSKGSDEVVHGGQGLLRCLVLTSEPKHARRAYCSAESGHPLTERSQRQTVYTLNASTIESWDPRTGLAARRRQRAGGA